MAVEVAVGVLARLRLSCYLEQKDSGPSSRTGAFYPELRRGAGKERPK